MPRRVPTKWTFNKKEKYYVINIFCNERVQSQIYQNHSHIFQFDFLSLANVAYNSQGYSVISFIRRYGTEKLPKFLSFSISWRLIWP